MTDERVRHGWDKEVESDDPQELVMEQVPGGDQELMVICLIEEYARMGMEEKEIFRLFSQDVYRTHELYQQWGAEKIRHLIRAVVARTGRTRISVALPEQNGG